MMLRPLMPLNLTYIYTDRFKTHMDTPSIYPTHIGNISQRNWLLWDQFPPWCTTCIFNVAKFSPEYQSPPQMTETFEGKESLEKLYTTQQLLQWVLSFAVVYIHLMHRLKGQSIYVHDRLIIISLALNFISVCNVCQSFLWHCDCEEINIVVLTFLLLDCFRFWMDVHALLVVFTFNSETMCKL